MDISFPFKLKVGNLLSSKTFFEFCQRNEILEFERDSCGDIIIIPLRGAVISSLNAAISANLGVWNQKNRLGLVFGSSTGFTLPNGSVRSPDVSWVRSEEWSALTLEEKESFAPLCPDFVCEIHSAPEELNFLKDKMIEYIDNGVKLGWLINLLDKEVYIYKSDQTVITHNTLNIKLSGESTLPDFVLDLASIIK